ncbi:TonB-dependent Receptor Plug Domain [Granulicella rosea]|uniref:TonB-dependent Receptor Plug Domain n=1 Tax=Granulicella rosea TaxID=474952 RepID=A0A239K1C4_9BACT|nr:carboxypeptidase regulatory-like domain-containing protein [Granulicella rosea]SNT12116.1 TonB-dependent Receptor Plug Domain [Granulicella rosea]
MTDGTLRLRERHCLAQYFFRFFLLLFLFLPGASPAFAQADTGSISGVVTDAQGAAIPQAVLTATRVESNATVTVKANGQGEYIFPSLQTGHYSLSVQVDGFAPETRQGYELNDGSAFSVNFSLHPGGASDQVIVTSEVGEMVNTQSGQVEHIIDGETVRDLALNGRNYLDLLATLPGSVTPDPTNAMDEITSGTTTSTVLNGMRATANGLYIDGTINKDISTNGTQFNNVGIDFIEHVSVQTSSFSAQWGDSGGPTINVVTRSGTNRVHGSAFELLRNNYLDAASYFSRNATTFQAIPNHLRFNDFGGAVGFPILHDKLFFFVGTEWKTIAQTSLPTTVSLPVLAAVQGNFTTTRNTCGLKNVPALQIAINTTTCDISNLITPFGKGIQQIYQRIISKATSYAGTNCGADGCTAASNSIFELAQPYTNHEEVARVDWTISPRDILYARFIEDTHNRTNPLGSGSLPTSSYFEHVPANNALVSYTHVVSPNSTNEIAVAGLWTVVRQTPAGDDWQKSFYGLAYEDLFTGYGPKLGIPSVSVAGYTAYKSDSFLVKAHTTYLQVKDLYSLVQGRHSLKFGGLYGRNRRDQNGQPNAYGAASFTTVSSTYTTGDPLADALLGNFQEYTESAYNTYGLFRMSQASAFVDDVWRASRGLSIDAGLRYEWTTPWTTVYDNIASFYPQFYDPAAAVTVNADGTIVANSGNLYNGLRRAGNGVSSRYLAEVPTANDTAVLNVPTIGKRGFYKSQRAFAPRLSFAYDPTGRGTLAIRGGAGLFYDMPQGSIAYSALNSPPYLPSSTIDNGNMDKLSSISAQQGTRPFGAIYATNPDIQRAYVYQYNLGVQKQLSKAIFFEVNYIGNQARHLLHNPDINGVDPAAEHLAYQSNPNMNINSVRPYKGYSSIYMYRSDADSNYNGLQVSANRRFGKARFSAAYTFSKALTTASSDNEVPLYAAYSKTYSYSYATYDRRQVVTSTFSLTAPTIHRGWRAIDGAIGNWLFTGAVRYQSGIRQTPYGNDPYGVVNRAVYHGYPVQYGHSAAQWWNTINTGDVINFEAPDQGQVGNSPKGIILGPALFNVDLSARKNFSIRDRYKLTVNLDAFNLTNHPQFGSPSVNVNSGTNYYVPNTTNTLDYKSIAITSSGRPRNLQAGLRLNF